MKNSRFSRYVYTISDRIWFNVGGGGGGGAGGIDPDAGISPSRHISTEKYTNENIYARCQSSVGYLAW